MGFWDAVASAGPYANNLHLTPNRQPRQHQNSLKIFTGRMLFYIITYFETLRTNDNGYMFNSPH